MALFDWDEHLFGQLAQRPCKVQTRVALRVFDARRRDARVAWDISSEGKTGNRGSLFRFLLGLELRS